MLGVIFIAPDITLTKLKNVLSILIICAAVQTGFAQFRVTPYLLPGDSNGNFRLTWITEDSAPGTAHFWQSTDTLKYSSTPVYAHELAYSRLEEADRGKFPDMFRGFNWKHTIILNNLQPNTVYNYKVTQGKNVHSSTFKTAPLSGTQIPVRFVAMADSETDPEGRTTYRPWSQGPQHPQSTGRPANQKNYFLTETEGFKANLKHLKENKPDFLLLAGDLVQGGGYQRAWDEFFFHLAGKFDDVLGSIPLLPAIGNWENFGGIIGGYEPTAIRSARAKYKAYFSLPENGSATYQDCYYRVDYGPVTILTIDSSNGLPDSTDNDTNININWATYPGEDLPDINPGSEQWNWVEKQLKSARDAGQVIFIQFHHIPYSSGGHILPLTMKGSSGQAGIPMRQYTPMFKKYGVAAVICGHNEALEHSIVDGIHFWDVGIAGDGFGYAIDDIDPRRKNEFSHWTAHKHSKELWEGKKLVDGGKHYGQLLVEVLPVEKGYQVKMSPKYIFPVTDDSGKVIGIENRVYDNEISFFTKK